MRGRVQISAGALTGRAADVGAGGSGDSGSQKFQISIISGNLKYQENLKVRKSEISPAGRPDRSPAGSSQKENAQTE